VPRRIEKQPCVKVTAKQIKVGVGEVGKREVKGRDANSWVIERTLEETRAITSEKPISNYGTKIFISTEGREKGVDTIK